MKNYIFLIIFFQVVINNSLGQNNKPDCYEERINNRAQLSIGLKYYGVGLGSFKLYNGVNLNISNHTCKLNGINFSLAGDFNSKVNGIDFSLIAIASKVNGGHFGLLNFSEKINGINLSLIYSEADTINGINFGFIGCRSKKINGISCGYVSRVGVSKGICLAGAQVGDSINGISIGGLINFSKKSKGISISGIWNFSWISKGLLIAPINTVIKETQGVQIGLYNHSNRMDGIQFGLINKIKENRKFFRVFPIVNFNFKKNSEQKKILPDSSFIAPSEDLTDSRDGKIYKTIQIGSQTWMAENLAYGTNLNIWPNNPDSHIYCFGEDSLNCKKFGMLYTFDEAKNVCPAGWHLPSVTAFDTLLAKYNNDKEIAYTALKVNGNSKFNALPSGYYSSGHGYICKELSFFWSSTTNKSFIVNSVISKAYISSHKKSSALSVRCIKD